MDMTQYLEIDENGVAIGGIYNAYDGNPPSNWIPFNADTDEDVGIGWKWTGTDWVDNRSYVEKRTNMYPPITEQLDMLYWDSVNGTTNWKDAITEIKEAYPKN